MKRYPSGGADGIDLDIGRGEIFGVLGRNGAGKTTMVECLQGLRRRDAGEVQVVGLDPDVDGAELRRRIGSQLQESSLPDRLRVREAVELFASASPGAADLDELLDDWGLRDIEREPFGTLSGGQQQRLFVALALVNDPEVVFLDEMTQGLDPDARRTALSLVRRLRDRGATVVMVTHYLDEAEALCDRVAVVEAGRVLECGAPAELVRRHGGPSRISWTATGCDVPLAALPGVGEVVRDGRGVRALVEPEAVGSVLRSIECGGAVPPDLEVRRPSLEESMLALVGAGEVA